MTKPSNWLEEFLDIIEAGKSLNDIQVAILALRDFYGVDHAVYHWMSWDGEQYGCGSYDPVWVQRYVDKDYVRIDPVIITTFNSFTPVDWRRLDWSAKATRDFVDDAASHGVGSQGFSIPIRGPNGQFALFTVNSSCTDDEWDTFLRNKRREVVLVAHAFNVKAAELAKGRVSDPTTMLSKRETDVLSLIASGKSRQAVSDQLAISDHTVRSYLESARFKLGASNVVHAVARASSEGLIALGCSGQELTGDWPGRE